MRTTSVFIVPILFFSLLYLGCGSSDQALRNARLPFGALDNPPAGTVIKTLTTIDGWALSEDGIDHVAIYLDRNFLENAVVKGKREDVIKAFPAFANVEDMRFVAELQADNIPPGAHEISARAYSRKGATRDFVPHVITIQR